MASYASLAELKAAMQQGGFTAGDTTDDAVLQNALDAASDWIDARTGRSFQTAETEAREFYATDAGRLDVVDVATITEVKVDSRGDLSYATTLTSGQYEVLPLLVGQPGVIGKGATLRILPTSSRQFSPGRRVRVTATWGFGSVPVRVKLACIRLAQRWFKLLRDAPLGVLQGPPDLGTFQTVSREDPMVATLLDDYIAAPASNVSWVAV